MFLRMIRGEEKSHATKKRKALKHCVSRLSVRETGLEEQEKRPYRTLPSLFVKNSFPYETSLYIPS
jgi:hypothetical protein